MGLGFAAFSAFELLGGDRTPELIDHAGRVIGYVLDRSFQVLGPERSRVSRAMRGSQVTMFISVSLNSECSLRFADHTVSETSSTIPILA